GLRDADYHRRAALAHAAEGLLDGGAQSDALERVVRAPAGERHHLADRVAVARRIDRVGGAEVARELELLVGLVDGDDLLAAGDRAALDRVEADASGAEHHAARARLDLRGVERRADAGHHGASDDRRLVDAHRGIDLDHVVAVKRRVLAHHARAGEMVQGVALRILVAAGPAPQREGRPGRDVAQPGLAHHAVAAPAAAVDPPDHHP